jgi:phage terminase Nu1 subunit (DNA packaging protein)
LNVETVTSNELAEILRVTRRRIEQLVNEGIVVRVDRGRYDLGASVGRYCDQLRQVAESATSTATNELTQERLKTIRTRNAERERVLINMEEAESVVDLMAGEYVSSLSGLPARIARAPAERRRIEEITDEMRRALADRFAELRTDLKTGVERR